MLQLLSHLGIDKSYLIVILLNFTQFFMLLQKLESQSLGFVFGLFSLLSNYHNFFLIVNRRESSIRVSLHETTLFRLAVHARTDYINLSLLKNDLLLKARDFII